MLQALDIPIGFITVMLVMSLVVTVLTQLFGQALNIRSRYLRDALVELFARLQWKFSGDSALQLATEIASARDALTREELVEILLELARKPQCPHAELKAELAAEMPAQDPDTALAHVRAATLEIGTEHAHLSSAAMRAMALARGPAAGLARSIFGVFDSTMDRAGARFHSLNRAVVLGFGLVVAVALPLDTFDLFQRFSRSDLARQEAMRVAGGLVDDKNPDLSDKAAFERLEAVEIVIVPKTFGEWLARWRQINWAGVGVSALLLSLGAPFWFHLLQDMLKLRSAVAGREQQDRALRDSVQPATGKIRRPGLSPPALEDRQ